MSQSGTAGQGPAEPLDGLLLGVLRRRPGTRYTRQAFMKALHGAGHPDEVIDASWAMLRALQRRPGPGTEVTLVAARTESPDATLSEARRLEDQLVTYLIDYKDLYTSEALSQRLITNGYSPRAVEAAWTAWKVFEYRVREIQDAEGRSGARRGVAQKILIALHVTAFLGVSAWLLLSLGLVPALIGVVLLVPGILGSLFLGSLALDSVSVGDEAALGRRNVVIAMATALAVPLAIAFGLTGLCVVVTVGIDALI